MDLNAPRWTAIAGTAYEIDERTVGGAWTRFRGGNLSRPIDVRFGVVGPRTRVLGLRVDDGLPVTAKQLREPRLPELESAFTRYLVTQEELHESYEGFVVESWEGADDLTDEQREDLVGTTSVVSQVRMDLMGWLDRLGPDESDVVLAGRGRGAAPPNETELRAFARTYLRQRLMAERGAKVRTAAEFGVHRSTVYRWITLCEEHGLFSTDEGATP